MSLLGATELDLAEVIEDVLEKIVDK